MSHFDVYGRMAEHDVDDVIQNGRYYSQKDAEKLMPQDIFRKLKLNDKDSLLDIGCGSGVNLREALKIVSVCAACDHPNVIKRLEQKPEFSPVSFYKGNFLDLNFERQFSKVLMYGVVPVLPDEDCLYAFIEKAVSLMSPDGLFLIGDVSNVDKKRRFIESERGKKFEREWKSAQENAPKKVEMAQFITDADRQSVTITDEIVFKILKQYRDRGFHTYLLDQPQNLPFGNTREDILIVGPEYQNELDGA